MHINSASGSQTSDVLSEHSSTKHLKCQCLHADFCLTPHKQKKSIAVQLMHKPHPMIWNISVNNEEHP